MGNKLDKDIRGCCILTNYAR